MSKTKPTEEPETPVVPAEQSDTTPESTAAATTPEAETLMSAAADTESEPRFEILFSAVGSAPCFTQGELVSASELEYLGIQRLLELGAIREL